MDLFGAPDPTGDPIGWALTIADRVALNVPPGTVKKLPMRDALGIVRIVQGFFGPLDPPTLSGPISNADAGRETGALSSV